VGHNFTELGLQKFDYTAYSQDSWGNINSVSRNTAFVVPNAPQIVFVDEIPPVTPVSGASKSVTFTFDVYDENSALSSSGYNDLNFSTLKAKFTRGSIERESLDGACFNISDYGDDNTIVQCTVKMKYFDEPGNWNISVEIQDKIGNLVTNESTYFHYNYATYMTVTPLNWENLGTGSLNVFSESPMRIFNRGNQKINSLEISAVNLNGSIIVEEVIDVGNFSVNLTKIDGSCAGNQLSHNVPVSVDDSVLDFGEDSFYDLYFCIGKVPEVSFQEYTSIWVIEPINFILSLVKSFNLFNLEIFAFAVGIVVRKRKKKVSDLRKKLKRKYGLKVDDLLSLDKDLKESGLNIDEFFEEVKEERELEIQIPIVIFRHNIGPAEVLCKYLKENKNMRFSEIGNLINRDERTVWINYRNALKKKENKMRSRGEIFVSVKIFADRKLSILESIVNYLKNQGLKNLEIAELLGKDQRNIWTLYSRVKKKLELEIKN